MAKLPQYFETSEADDAIGSLRHLEQCLKLAKSDAHAWKWVVLSLFSLVQGAIVCHVSGTTQVEALKSDNAKKLLAWLDCENSDTEKYPEPYLAHPDTLYNRLQGKDPNFPPYGGIIETSASQNEAFDKLKHFRDNLTHFHPKGWLIEIAHIQSVIPPMLELILEINSKDWAFRHATNAQDLPILVNRILAHLLSNHPNQ